jgi:hypothetical protein
MGAFSEVLHFFLKATREALDNGAETLHAIQIFADLITGGFQWNIFDLIIHRID